MVLDSKFFTHQNRKLNTHDRMYFRIINNSNFIYLKLINLAILISGRGSNMTSILSSIQNGEISNVVPKVVISNNNDALGIKIAKTKFKIPTEIILPQGKKGWEYDSQIVDVLKKYQVLSSNGLICLAGYMKILSKDFIDQYPHRIMNIHPALLPAFPGLHAQKQAIEYGVKVSGCTVHFVDSGVDTGPIILQESVIVYPNDTEETLSNRILEVEHKLYPMAINLLANNRITIKKRMIKID